MKNPLDLFDYAHQLMPGQTVFLEGVAAGLGLVDFSLYTNRSDYQLGFFFGSGMSASISAPEQPKILTSVVLSKIEEILAR